MSAIGQFSSPAALHRGRMLRAAKRWQAVCTPIVKLDTMGEEKEGDSEGNSRSENFACR